MEPTKEQLRTKNEEEIVKQRELRLGNTLIELHQTDPDKREEYDRLYTEYHLRKIRAAKKPKEGLVSLDEKEQILAFVKGIITEKPNWLKDEDEKKRDSWSYTDI